MTRQAIHPRTRRLMTPEEFSMLEGPNYRGKAVFPLCPACGAELSLYGVHSPSIASRFDHPDHSDCELSCSPDPRFAHLKPSGWDLEQGVRLFATFCETENLKAVYALCRKICGRLTGGEFLAMCRAADRKNVWAYRGITLEYLPYVLVTLVDLEKDETRKWPLRIIRHKPARSFLDALWQSPEACTLRKAFADTGKPMRDADISIPQSWAETAWIPDVLPRKIRECCVHGSKAPHPG